MNHQAPHHTIPVRILRDGARLPHRASAAATGYDLHASLDAPVTLGQVPVAIPTGLAFEVPPGVDAQVRPRSGLASRGILSTFGTLDPDYRGEVFVTMYTTSPDIDYEVRDGDRIAQLVLAIACEAAFEPAAELADSARGAGRFGSTGR